MKRFHTVFTVPLFFVIMLALLLIGNTQTWQVIGTLVSDSDAPIADHQVYLYNSEDEQIASDKTDDQGRFTLTYQTEPTSADPGSGPESPSEFKLGSSYPNPFNPRTTVSFEAPESTTAIIAVYNILGQEVMRTRTDFSPGSHEIVVNLGGRLSQGQYLLRVQGNGFSLTQSMTFVSAGISSGTPGITVRSGGGGTRSSGSGTRSGGGGTRISIAAESQALETPEMYRIVVEGSDTFEEKQIEVPARQNYDAGKIKLTQTDTEVVEVTSTTGRIWMNRNLGASRAATSSTDELAYGDLYQWGRPADGHQRRNSPTTSTFSGSDQPDHGSFILATSSPYDWRSPTNNSLWRGVNGINNPCPAGYRLPTDSEWEAERQSWSSKNSTGAFASPLKLPIAGFRIYSSGSLGSVGSNGFYWSSTVSGTGARYLGFNRSGAYINTGYRAYGRSVRCLKD